VNLERYPQHLTTLHQRWQAALEFAGFDAAIVAAGSQALHFLDDHGPPFRPNPHFAQWFPDADCAEAVLLIEPGCRPRLYFHQPRDFWHQPPRVPGWAEAAMDVAVFAEVDDLARAVGDAMASRNRLAYVGERPPGNLGAAEHNPALLLNHLHYHRAYKTAFEIDCMARANDRAVAGHEAAREAFEQGASEFDTHMRYLAAARHTPAELPYSSIVAHNRHAGVLHYQHYDREPPAPLLSFLIDAGASVGGYAADVTRTYAADPDSDFAALVRGLDAAQQRLIDAIRPGMNYGEVHAAAHRAVATLLADHGIVRCSAEAAFEHGITRTFLPHGVGHLIGLQVHDVGGQQASPEGGIRPPPAEYPALRLTRTVEPDQAFTIEPGLYFVPLLLDELRDGAAAAEVDWQRVEQLTPWGGIRIEDDVVVSASGTRNLTREAFAREASDRHV